MIYNSRYSRKAKGNKRSGKTSHAVVGCTIIEPLLQIRRLFDFCWPHFCTFCPGILPIVLHLPMRGSHIFISSFSVHKLLL